MIRALDFQTDFHIMYENINTFCFGTSIVLTIFFITSHWTIFFAIHYLHSLRRYATKRSNVYKKDLYEWKIYTFIESINSTYWYIFHGNIFFKLFALNIFVCSA